MSSFLSPAGWRLGEWQLRIFFILNAIFLPMTFFFGFQGVQASIAAIVSFIFIVLGRKVYEEETSENWLDFSVFKSVRNALGAILILTGWIGFLRGVFAVAVASLILWLE